MATKKNNNQIKKKDVIKKINNTTKKNTNNSKKKVNANNKKKTNKAINSTSIKKISNTKTNNIKKEQSIKQKTIIKKEQFPNKEKKDDVNKKIKQVDNTLKNYLNKLKYKKKIDKIDKNKKINKKYDLFEEDLPLLNYKDYKGFEKIKVFFINRSRVMKSDMKKFKRKYKYGTLKDKILILLMLGLIALVTLFIIFCAYIIISAPDISEERLYKGNATVLYDINGNEFARLGTENREKVSYDDLPEVLIDAIIATEDSRFFQHNGIDIARFAKAVVGQLAGRNAGGGSTLTMQVSKNAATSTESNGLAGIVRKFQDIYLSVFVFEKKFTKENIIEFYVNLPNLGAGSYGVQQASQVYFGKDVSQLTLTEAALIAGLFQAPSSYNPYNYPEKATKRRNLVLDLMYRHNYITAQERDAAKNVDVESLLVGRNTELNQYQGFIDTVVNEVEERTGNNPYKVSMNIYTTMDPKAQDVVNGIMNGDTYTWKNEKAQAGIAVISVENGSLTAVGAGRNKNSELSFNYATSARKHPGSTAKPIMDYGPAMEYLDWSTGQTLVDDKTTYSNGTNIKNFDNGYKGIMTAKTALAQSRNIPALVTFQQTTNEQKQEFATGLGWKPVDAGDGTILESCSIGGFDGVTPLEAASAYSAFARGGIYIEPYSFTKIEYTDSGDIYELNPEKKQVMSEETAYLITVMLKYAVTSGNVGAGSVSGTDIAAKTGTSTIDTAKKKTLGLDKKDVIGDSWEVAYSPDYTVATWYGYEKITSEYWLSNREGGEARKAITKLLTKGIFKKNSRFKEPNGITTATIELETDPLELASDYTPDNLKSVEYFKKGTVPTSTSNRFSQLENPTNLKYANNNGTITLSWNEAKTPDAINEEYLKNYFKSSPIYERWADKYLEKRLSYNSTTFGALGYHVYVQNSTGTIDLGFTTNTTFNTTIAVDDSTTFIVKTSYERFTSNMSRGISVKAINNTQNETTNTTTSKVVEDLSFIPRYAGNSSSCTTLDEFNGFGTNPKDRIRVTDKNGNDITNSNDVHVSFTSCADETGSINCNEITNPNKTYYVQVLIWYKNNTNKKNLDVTIKPSC